jgi:hypothetical protein
MKIFLIAALIAAAGLVCASGAWAQGPPAGASSSTAGSGSGLPAGPTTPNTRPQFCTETPSGGVAPANCTWGLAGATITDRASNETSYLFGCTDIGNYTRVTNVNGETLSGGLTIPDGNTGCFVPGVNIGIIIEAGYTFTTLSRQTSSQIRCQPNAALTNTCSLTPGVTYILVEDSGFNYTLNVQGVPQAQNIHEYDLFCDIGNGYYGTHNWSFNGTGAGIGSLNGASTKYPCGFQISSGATSGNWVFFDFNNNGPGAAPQYQNYFGSSMAFAFQRTNAQSAPQEIMEVGLADTSLTVQPANFVGLRAVATAAKVDFFAVCRTGAADGTPVDSTVLEDTAIHFVFVTFISQNSVFVSLDGGTPLNITTGCATGATVLTPVFYISTSEAVTKKVNVLYWEWNAQVVRP